MSTVPKRSPAPVQDVFDQAPLAMCQLDHELHFCHVNDLMADMHALAADAHVGKTPEMLLHGDLAALYRKIGDQVMRKGEAIDQQLVRVRSPSHQDALRDWLVACSPYRGTDSIDGVIFTAIDVTERRDFERRLIAERRVAQILARADHLEAALPAALDGILDSFDLAFCEYWTPREDDHLYREMLRSGGDDNEDLLEAIPLAFGEGLIGEVYVTHEPVFIPDVTTDGRFLRREAASAIGLQTGFAFPVMVDENCTGVISLFSNNRLEIETNLSGVLRRLGQEIGQFVHRSEIKRAARENEARTQVVIESALDAVISIDEDGSILEWNPRAAEMFGPSRAEVLGRDLAEIIIPHEMRDVHHKGLRHFLDTGEGPVLRKRIEVSALRSDGTLFPVELTVLPLNLENRYEFTAYVRDITERKEAETALLEADRRKTEFLAILGHELRNPLATIANCTMLLEDQPEAATKYAAIMRPQVDHLRSLLDDLLDVTRISRGKIALNRAAINVHSLLEAAIVATRPAMDERRQTLQLELDDVVTEHVYADATRIQQIVGNLLSNASRYSPQGSVIRLTATRDDAHFRIKVSDSGMGIPADRIDDIFDAFTQVRDDDGDTVGLGIGLTLVKLLTEMHGGTVTVESPGRNQGSTFEVLLPAKIPASATPPPARRQATRVGNQFHVLVIDDNVPAAKTLGQLIKHKYGCRVEIRFDGQSGLGAAREDTPDLMLVDIQLPDISGLEIAASVRADDGFSDTRLVALSGYGHQEAIVASLEAGFDEHLAKPIDIHALTRLISPADTGPA